MANFASQDSTHDVKTVQLSINMVYLASMLLYNVFFLYTHTVQLAHFCYTGDLLCYYPGYMLTRMWLSHTGLWNVLLCSSHFLFNKAISTFTPITIWPWWFAYSVFRASWNKQNAILWYHRFHSFFYDLLFTFAREMIHLSKRSVLTVSRPCRQVQYICCITYA